MYLEMESKQLNRQRLSLKRRKGSKICYNIGIFVGEVIMKKTIYLYLDSKCISANSADPTADLRELWGRMVCDKISACLP